MRIDLTSYESRFPDQDGCNSIPTSFQSGQWDLLTLFPILLEAVVFIRPRNIHLIGALVSGRWVGATYVRCFFPVNQMCYPT